MTRLVGPVLQSSRPGLLPPCDLGLPELLLTRQALSPAVLSLPFLPLNRGAPQLSGLWVRIRPGFQNPVLKYSLISDYNQKSSYVKR